MTEAHTFFDLKNLLTYQNVLVIVATYSLVVMSRKVAPRFFVEGLGNRLLPVMPVIYSQGLVWATMSFQPTATIGERILLGIVLGAIASNGHSVLKRFGFNDIVPGLRDNDRGMGPPTEDSP